MIHRIPGACFGHDECVFSRAVSIATVHFFFSPRHHRASASAPPRRRRQRQRRCNTIRYTLRQVTTADEFSPQTNSTPTDFFSFLFFFPFRFFLPTNFPRRAVLARAPGALSFSYRIALRAGSQMDDLSIPRSRQKCCTAREAAAASRGGGPRTVAP